MVVVKNIFKCEICSPNCYCYHIYHLSNHLIKEIKTTVGFRTEDIYDVAGSVEGSVPTLPPLPLPIFFCLLSLDTII